MTSQPKVSAYAKGGHALFLTCTHSLVFFKESPQTRAIVVQKCFVRRVTLPCHSFSCLISELHFKGALRSIQ